jgi:hypothetical protein
MPVPNDLTPEEEAQFAEHGVQPAGPGREPLGEGQQQPPAQEQQGQEQQGQEQQGQQQGQPRDDRGRFAPAQQGQEQQQGQQQGQEQQGQEQGQEQEPRMVPLEALHAERQRVRQMAQQMQTLQTRTNMILQTQQQGQPQQQLDANLNNDEAVFALAQPDYHQASDYYVNSRAQELLRFYPPQQAQQMLLNEAREIARQSWQRGQSAAETVYGLAMARGYNPNTAQREPQQGQQQQQQGQQQGRQPSAQELVNGVRNGQQASRSLSGGAGASRAGVEFEASLRLGEKGANTRFAAIGG